MNLRVRRQILSKIVEDSITIRKKNQVQTTLLGEKAEEDWSFSRARTSYLTHGLHEYPARMIPQIARRLILRYSSEKERILDPFCGSGTTLIEARFARRYSAGIDINPFAVLLSKVKTTPIDFRKMGFDPFRFIGNLETEYEEAKKDGKLPTPPVHIFHNLLHWFKEPVARDLEFLYHKIQEVDEPNVADLLKIVFSDTMFKTSNIDLRSSRFLRILPKKKLTSHNPNVLMHFRKKLIDSIRRVEQFTKRVKGESEWAAQQPVVIVAKEDARKLPFNNGEFEAIVTSPPYGEEKNTVGYFRWAKLSLLWLRLDGEVIKKLEKQTLGALTSSNVREQLEELPSPTAASLLREVFRQDEERVRDALPFFFDYLLTLKEMYRTLKPGSFCCIVVGDRSIRKRPLNMERVTIELGQEAGFVHKTSFFRQIPQKLIPWTTPTGKTISSESMVILTKK